MQRNPYSNWPSGVDIPYGLKRIIESEWGRVQDRVASEFGTKWKVAEFPWRAYLGRGYYGAVFSVGYPWVVKFTLDEYEGRLVHLIMTDIALRKHPGVAYHIDQWSSRYEAIGGTKRVDVFLREDILPISSFSSLPAWKESKLRINELRNIVMKAEVSHDPQRKQELFENWNEAVNEAVDYDPTALVAEFMLSFFESTGIVLTDVHFGNVGIRRTDDMMKWFPELDDHHARDEMLVIFDIGHSKKARPLSIPDYSAPILNPTR